MVVTRKNVIFVMLIPGSLWFVKLSGLVFIYVVFTKIHYFFSKNVCTIYKLQIFNRRSRQTYIVSYNCHVFYESKSLLANRMLPFLCSFIATALFSFFCGMLPSPTFCVPSQFVSWSVRPLEPPSTSLIDELVRRGVDVSAVFDGTTLSFAHHVVLDNNSLVINK